MITYEQIYKKLGTRKIADMIDPKVLIDTEFVFPIKSILLWNNHSEIPIGPTREYGYLANVKLPTVVTIYEYTGNMLGRYRLNSTKNPATVISQLRKLGKGFKYLRPNSKELKVENRKLLIMNFGALTSFYKYQPDPLNAYYTWYNQNTTVYNLASSNGTGTNRHKFILMKVPLLLPTRELLTRHSLTKVTRLTLEEFDTDSKLNMLDVWKFLNPNRREESTLNSIPEEDMNNVTILFRLNDKVTMLNLGLLASIVKDYEITTKLAKYDYKTVQKIFFIYMSRFISNAGVVARELEHKTTNNINTSNIIDIVDQEDIDVHNDVDVNDVLENELIEPTIVKEEVDDEDNLLDTIDTMVTANDIDNIVDEDTNKYESLKQIIHDKNDYVKTTNISIDKLVTNKLITKNKAAKLKEILANQDKTIVKIPGKGAFKLKDLLTVTQKELTITQAEKKLPNSKLIFDKREEEDTISVFRRKYMNKVYNKDLTSVMYGIQNNNIVVDEYNINQVDNIMGGYEEHTIVITPLNGLPSKLKINLPVVNDDGTFKMSGNVYNLRTSKTDIPIRKINYNQVALTTYYGKLFITKAKFKKDDIGFWFRKQLLAKYETNDKLKDLVLMPVKNMDAKLPLDYMNISRYVKSFTLGNKHYSFDYATRNKMLHEKTLDKLHKLEKKDMVLVGMSGKSPLLMDGNNIVWLDRDDAYVEVGSIYDQLGIDKSDGPIEHASIRIYKQNIPVVILLSYYLGLESLLKLLGTKYTKHKSTERIAVDDTHYVIRFKDIKLIIERDYDKGDMILGGLTSLKNIIKTFDYGIMNKQSMYSLVFTKLTLALLYANEIKLLERMFVDPISKTLLEEINEPTTFKGLLIRSVELLVDDNYVNPNNISGSVLKGHERIPGMIYNEIVKAIKEHDNRSVFSKSKIEVNPFSVWNRIGEDSATVLVEDLNPLAELKQSEDLTMMGFMGMNKISINREARAVDPSEIGIVSEASKDSGDVGTTMYMSANPKIESIRGVVGKYDDTKDSKASTMSTIAMLMPGSTKDDVKRLTN